MAIDYVPEGACIGEGCAFCAVCVEQGWTCRLGTLTGEEISIYLNSLHSKNPITKGYWTGKEGLDRGKLLLRFGVIHILGITSRESLTAKFGRQSVRKLCLLSWMNSYIGSYYQAVDRSFPEFGIMPWELRVVPRGFWDKPGAGLAALRWFLEKQGWTPSECHRRMITRPVDVYSLLSACGLAWLRRGKFRIFNLLKELDSSLEPKPISVLRQEKKLKQAASATLECPLCHGYYRSLIYHRRAHPDYNQKQWRALFPPDMNLELPELNDRRHAPRRIHSRSSHLVGSTLSIPVENWKNVRWVALGMQEWSEALEIWPIPATARNSVVSACAGTRRRRIYIFIPKEIVDEIDSDVIVREVGRNVVALRFRSDKSRQIVWEWYQQRSAKPWYATPERKDKIRLANLQKPKRPNTSSRYKWVNWNKKRQTWRAAITFQGSNYYLGQFTSEEEAARAVDIKARELYGDAAWLNFP